MKAHKEETVKSTVAVQGMIAAYAGIGAAITAGRALLGVFKDLGDYVRRSAEEFAAFRQKMQETATLKGSAKLGQVHSGGSQESLGLQLDADRVSGLSGGVSELRRVADRRPPGQAYRAQGEDYAGRVAELMKSSGVAPAVGAELAGSLLENAKGPQNVDNLMKRLSKTFTVLEKGRVPLGRALPQMSRIMGHGISAEESAQLFSIASPVSPGEEGTAVEAALRAIEEMKSKGTGEEFGVKRGMGQFESVKAFAQNIDQRKKALIAGGKTEQEAQDELNALLEKKKVANDIRERRGLIGGFGRQGIELGGFERYGRIAAETPDDFESARKKRYEESDQGRQDRIAAASAVENLELARGTRKSSVDATSRKSN